MNFILQDDREIVSLFSGSAIISVGNEGVTKIIAYEEPGIMSMVTYFAVYKGEFLWKRIDAIGWGIEYKEEN
jgi:hypothetical protein